MSPHICHCLSSCTYPRGLCFSYRHRRIHDNNVAFLDQQLSCFVAHLADLDLGYRTASAQLRDSPGWLSDLVPPVHKGAELLTCPDHSCAQSARPIGGFAKCSQYRRHVRLGGYATCSERLQMGRVRLSAARTSSRCQNVARMEVQWLMNGG